MGRVVALLLAGGQGDRLSILSEERAKPAVCFGGKYRIIDFTLNNCINSGIPKIGVLTQYRPRSLSRHIGDGKPWDMDRSNAGVVLLPPYRARHETDWYRGTANAVYQNLEFVAEQRADYILILAGDHIYQMAYDQMLAFHCRHQADLTIAVTPVPLHEANRYGIVTVDEHDQVVEFYEKPAYSPSNLASMGIYVFSRDVLFRRLEEDAHRRSSHDFGKDIVPAMVRRDRVVAYPFRGYWRDVGTVQSYWEANMELLEEEPAFDLCEPGAIVRTRSAARPPARIGPRASVSRSLLCDGCTIKGEVHHSVLSPGVVVEEGAIVEDSVIFDDTVVGPDATVRRCIVDKEVWIGAGAHLGYSTDCTPNCDEPQHLNSGITLVGKRARVPEGVKVGRNCKIDPGACEADFDSDLLRSGGTVPAGGTTRPIGGYAAG